MRTDRDANPEIRPPTCDMVCDNAGHCVLFAAVFSIDRAIRLAAARLLYAVAGRGSASGCVC